MTDTLQQSPETATLNGCDSTDGSEKIQTCKESRLALDEEDSGSLSLPFPQSNLDLEKGGIEVDGSTKEDVPRNTQMGQNEGIHIIKFNGPTDPDNPMNWNLKYKWMITAILASMTFATTFTSAIFSTAVDATSKKFRVSTEVMTLGTSLFLLGFGFGPIIWGPLSELYGRRLPLFIGILGMCLFQVGVAVALNLYTVMICRFFAGLLGSAPLAVVGGSLADFWDPVARGVTVGVYTMCTFVGPVAAPIVGGYIVESYLGWRWTEYVSVIMGKWDQIQETSIVNVA